MGHFDLAARELAVADSIAAASFVIHSRRPLQLAHTCPSVRLSCSYPIRYRITSIAQILPSASIARISVPKRSWCDSYVAFPA